MAKPKIDRSKTTSVFHHTLQTKKNSANLLDDEYLLLSFRHLDRNQGHTLDYWQEQKMLASAMQVIAGTCSSKLAEVFRSGKCTIYGAFPPKDKTTFSHPVHVPEDAQWARIHITGKQCIIGHVVKHTFYIVFLDGDHEFWESNKKNT